MNENTASLLRRALPMLCKLGDFVGNGPINPSRPDSIGERCDLIGDIRDALDVYNANARTKESK